MSITRVLAAAAALRQFTLEEIEAFCDEHPPAIVEILAESAPAVERIDSGSDVGGGPRWRVVDRGALRRRIEACDTERDEPVAPIGPAAEQRLRYAEETLAQCGTEPSARRRRVLVATAVNHLRQVLATDLPGRPDWWTVQMGEELEAALRRHPDPVTATRLQLDVAIAQLAVGNVRGIAVPAPDLLDAVARFQDGAARLDGQEQVPQLAGCFVDLVTAQLAPTAAGAVDQLVVAVARRRVRAQASVDAVAAIRALEPLVRGLGTGAARAPVPALHQMLRNLPDGWDHAVVYADLLAVVPARFRWQHRGERLPGALVEVVAEPVVTTHLAHCARTLEADLCGSGFRSENALIGQAAHVLQEFVERGAAEDCEVRSRGDRTRAELLHLAGTPCWPAPVVGTLR